MIDAMRDFPANPGAGPARTGSGRSVRRRTGTSAGSVALVVYDGVGVFELGVACDVFGNNDLTDLGVPWYRLSICSAGGIAVTADGGLQIHPPFGLERTRRVDTVVVPPTDRLDDVPTEVFDTLRRAHARGCRIISLCTGAFVLAEAGLLEGRRATTHWTECDDLARRYTDVRVDPDVLYVDEGDILTSAGSAASIDLCLYVVRCDHGSEIATQLARQLVVPPQRDGGQAQYIAAPLPTLDSSDLFADTVAWVQAHLDEPLRVADLAARSAMSPRTFARQFVAVTGTTPHQWLQRQRVHLAQRLLETTDLSIESVAVDSGFCTAGNLRKHFSRTMHTTPQAYRRTFARRAG
jgi:AraC family transcriptional regulator, transcriptional activator FtrA